MERIKVKVKVTVPTCDRRGFVLPRGEYEMLITGVSTTHIIGNINEVEFTFPVKRVLKMISQLQFPRLTIEAPVVAPRHQELSPVGGNSCMICLSSMNSDHVSLPCMHRFHRNCISRWLYTHTTCPVCRTRVTSSFRARMGLNYRPSISNNRNTNNRNSSRNSSSNYQPRFPNQQRRPRPRRLRRDPNRTSLPDLFRG
jgi:hypothetical protein